MVPSDQTSASSSSSAAPPGQAAHAALAPPSHRAPQALPRSAEEILNLIFSSESLQYVSDIVVPSLQDIANGKVHENSMPKLKAKETKEYGEQLLCCGQDDRLYGIEEVQIPNVTAGLTYIVSARLNVYKHLPGTYKADLFNFAIKLCNLGDSRQFYMVPQRAAQLAWGLLRLSQHLNKVQAIISPLQVLIQKSCTSGHFSGIYPAYLEACLLARDFQAGQLVLDQVFLHVRSAGPTYLDILTYYHHAGLILSALKEYGQAAQNFATAVSLPTTTASAIQLACAKRAILCQLLDTGKRIHFPRYTASTVTRMIDKNAGAYIDLAKEYEACRWNVVRDIAAKPEFANDCNKSLVDQVLKSITKRRILQLREIYSRMTINDLVARVGPDGKETVETVTAILGEMITSGSLNAIINAGTTPATSIVTFREDSPATLQTQTQSQSQTGATASTDKLIQLQLVASRLEKELSEMSKRLGISTEYLKKQANILEMSGSKGKGSNSRMDDFDQMMAAEEYGVGSIGSGRGIAAGGSGSRHGGSGVRGVGGNLGDMGF
ncbi:uncharacterized protein I303_102562 [Kwoniella dejecticola CBS 10117]|uniref:COP9 signalosome complex subunit 3 N-terminal helical repeats domain-containing protein n=1 Tax=Kwoniella dejecticola CBS 10117 TaxID=1296121 RepID=A0A1A6A934_9TREE|nr:uncharacterized protein I303_02576 [Kwoniella dejecticola CBS 10117]OBR86568.1 hypothetical protein I303_02576 [Kwoniella dejecticola CBS 10117]